MSRQFTFDCPECDVEVEVDAAIRTEMLDVGCVLCDAPVTSDAFSRPSASDATR